MRTPDTTTEEIPGGSRQPRVLFTVGGTAFELVRKLEVRSTGELLMLARRRYRGGLGGPVVVKRLRNPATFVDRRRLVEEVELTFRLNHPAIAQTHHLKVYRGVPYVVMEYVEGRSLDTVLNLMAMRRRPLSTAFAAYVVAEVAEALHHAHTLRDEFKRPLRIVHRDVSPRNVRVGVHGEVKLTNFSAAVSTLPGREVTSRPLLRGDIAYASPEALLRRPVDARSDLFALGLVLLELLTGQHPLGGEEAVNVPIPLPGTQTLETQGPTWMPVHEVVARMTQLEPEKVARLVAGAPAPLQEVVRRALRQSPEERFQTAEEVAGALRGWLREHASGYGRGEVREEVVQAAAEATGRRNQASLLEGGLQPAEVTAEEAALAAEPREGAPGEPGAEEGVVLDVELAGADSGAPANVDAEPDAPAFDAEEDPENVAHVESEQDGDDDDAEDDDDAPKEP